MQRIRKKNLEVRHKRNKILIKRISQEQQPLANPSILEYSTTPPLHEGNK